MPKPTITGFSFKMKGKLEDAIKSYKNAILLKPNYAEAYNNLGVALKDKGNLEEAIDAYKKAVLYRPEFYQALLNLGRAFKFLDNFAEATNIFQKILKYDKDDTLGVGLELATLEKAPTPFKTPKTYMNAFYAKRAKNWDNLCTDNNYFGHFLISQAFSKTHLQKRKYDILDIGCGTGSLASFLGTFARKLHGVDISPDMIRGARKKNLYDVLFEEEIESHLENSKYSYDSIIAAAVLVHFFHLEKIFSLVHKNLKPNGTFIFSIFEERTKDKTLNNLLLYSHSEKYIIELSRKLKFSIVFSEKYS